MAGVDFIQERLPLEELLAQLAEEAAELSKAALKLRRVLDGRNPTPVSVDAAFENFEEEVADVLLCIRVLGFSPDSAQLVETMKAKMDRWVRRLKEGCTDG